MADSSEKTEDPTGKRLEEARNKGQIARSRELSTTLVLVASSLMFLLFGSFIAEALFATALGLLAAIPAVIAYNKFNSDTKNYTARLDNFSKRFLSII